MKTTTIIKIMCLIASLSNFLDLITALMIGDAESNPVYLFSPVLFVIGKLFYSAVFIWFAFTKRNDTRYKKYLVVVSTLYAVFLFSLGFISNIHALMNPEIIVEAGKYTVQQKTNFYKNIVLIPLISMVAKDLLVFKLYDGWLKNDGDVK